MCKELHCYCDNIVSQTSKVKKVHGIFPKCHTGNVLGLHIKKKNCTDHYTHNNKSQLVSLLVAFLLRLFIKMYNLNINDLQCKI